MPAADKEMEGESSDDEMEEGDGQDIEEVSTTDGGGGGEATDGGTQQDPT